MSYDHIELNFYLNGKPIGGPVMGIKGTVYPVLYGNYFQTKKYSNVLTSLKKK